VARWSKDYNPQPLLDRLNKSRSINKDGQVQFGGFGIYKYLAHIDLMLELAIDVPGYEKRGLVQNAIFKAGKATITKGSLLKELNLIEKQYLVAEDKIYYLASSISINYLRRKLPKRRIGDIYLSFTTKLSKPFIKARKHCSFFQYSADRIDYPRDYLLVKVRVKAKSTHQAVQNALIGLNLYRSFLNFSNNLHHSYSFSFGAKREPINQILLGPIHTLHNINGHLATEELWTEEDYRGPCKSFDPPVVGEYEKKIKLAHDFIRKSKMLAYKESFEEALLRYNDALDCYDWNNAFIKLWSVLELLTNTLNEPYKTTIRRAAFLYEDYQGAKQSLEILKEYRNSVIHRGGSAGDIQIFIYDLKGYVEGLLLFLLDTKFNFSSFEEVAEFFDQPRDAVVLNQKLNILTNAKKFLKA
jgi:hypothetical protein